MSKPKKYTDGSTYYSRLEGEKRRNHLDRRNAYYQNWRRQNPEAYLLSNAKQRAIKRNIPFDISESDIKVPEYCPVLGVKLTFAHGRQRDCSPSIDRIDNEKGYVKGNVIVVSFKANKIKCDCDVDDIRKVYEFYSALKLAS